MASTKQPLLFENQFGGIDSTSIPHLVSDNSWTQCHVMRPFLGRLEQVARKVKSGNLEGCCPHETLALINIPSRFTDHGHCLALTKEHAWQVRNTISSSVKLGDVTGVLPFSYDSTYRRWGVTVYNHQAFFVNEKNSVLASDGTRVRYLDINGPKARYISHYFDHLILGWVNYNGQVMPERMLWSDLYNINRWDPARNNEADHWDFAEDATGKESKHGLTGMEKIGDTLFIYTPTSIRPVRYVGLPKVFQVGENLTGGIGNGLPYTIVRAGNRHFFFDSNEGLFFEFDGSSVSPIGGPVMTYLQENATTDPDLLARTWAYHRPEFYEVAWVFCSRTSTGNFDLSVVYNYRAKSWFTTSVENVHCFGGGIRRSISIAETADAYQDLEVAIEDLADGVSLTRLFGSADGAILREATSDDAKTSLLQQDTPVLVTKDFHFGTMQEVKEIDTITPHVGYDGKLEARYATRDYVDQDVTFSPSTVWDPVSEFGRLTDLRIAGRLLRFKFQPQASGSTLTSTTNCPIPSPALHDELELRLPFHDGPTKFGATLIGVTSDYFLSSYRAPALYDLLYSHHGGALNHPSAL